MELAYTNLNLVEEEKLDDSTETDEATDEEPGEESNDNKEEDEDMDDDYQGFAFLQNDIMCYLQDKPGIPSWILLDSQSKTRAASHFFNIRDDAKKLPKSTAQVFHHLVTNYCTYPEEQGGIFKWW